MLYEEVVAVAYILDTPGTNVRSASALLSFLPSLTAHVEMIGATLRSLVLTSLPRAILRTD